MPCFLGTPSLCPSLLRHVRSLLHAAPLSPHRGHRITCCPPLHRFPPPPFPGHSSSSAFFPGHPPLARPSFVMPVPFGAPYLFPTAPLRRSAPRCPAPIFPFLVSARPRPSPSFPVPTCRRIPRFRAGSCRPFLSGGRRFWHENAKYFFIWEIIVNFLLLLAFNVK